MSTKDAYFSGSKPIRLGVLMDMPDRIAKFAYPIYEHLARQYFETGRLHKPVEFVVRTPFGPPSGYIDDVMRAYHDLCDEGVLAVIGPNHSDSNLAITRHAEQRKVPIMTLGAVHTHISEHVFNIGWGSLPEDGYTVASWLQQNGHKRVTLTYDNAAHCKMYAQWFRLAAKRMGIKIIGDSCYSEVNEEAAIAEMREILDDHRARNPDAIVCFGTGASQINWGKLVHAAGWDVPRIMNGAFHQAFYPYTHEFLDGWVGTGMWDDDNETLAAFREEITALHPMMAEAAPELIAVYRDGIVALLEGVVNAPIMTPEGLLAGLEMVRMVPAAMGGNRTSLSFGPYDHKGHKGMDNMVVRRLTNGQLVMEGRFAPV
jgi:ABC-type branched-subunit amino acid transport system substrate-binding protein